MPGLLLESNAINQTKRFISNYDAHLQYILLKWELSSKKPNKLVLFKEIQSFSHRKKRKFEGNIFLLSNPKCQYSIKVNTILNTIRRYDEVDIFIVDDACLSCFILNNNNIYIRITLTPGFQ